MVFFYTANDSVPLPTYRYLITVGEKKKVSSLKKKKSSKRVMKNTMDLNIEITKVLLADAAMKLPIVATTSQKVNTIFILSTLISPSMLS